MNELGLIYYTDNRPDKKILDICQTYLKKATNLPIVSTSLEPIDFGKNIVLHGQERSYPTMTLQILTALENLDTKYVFFTEHDVLYHPSHFDFIPPRDDIYYYNINNWRWHYPRDYAISYDGLTSLSGMCCNRELAVKHYQYRMKTIIDGGFDKIRSREPRWARRFGYEPGTKLIRRGGITDETHETRRSEFPNVDIRHKWTFSAPKIHLHNFIKPPQNWREATLAEIPGWDIKGIFNL